MEGTRNSRLGIGIGVAVAVALAGVSLAWHFHAAPSSAPIAPVADTTDLPIPPPAAAMPSTEDADKMFRGLVAGLSPSALYGRLLKEEDLARRFVAAVNMIADGNVPRTVVAFMAPHGRFSVHEREGRTFVDPKGFARYDAVASVVASLDVGGTARAYAALHPLLDSAYSQIGKPGTTLDGRLTEAIQRVVSPSASAEPMELVASGVIYKFADAKVEGLPSCTKQLLRMGPTNMQLIQDKLRDVASALHLTLVAVAPAGAEASPR